MTTDKQEKEYGESDVFVYASGIVFCSVCAPENMSRSEVERLVNMQNPSGVTPWKISEERFATGEENPHKCEKYDQEKRLHYLLNC